MDEDRMKHSLAVAKKMMEIGRRKGLTEQQIQELFVIGINHDIGYEFGTGDNHNVVGGNIMKENGFKYWKEIYYHGKADVEYNSLYLDILNEADMKINKYGEDVGYEKRLQDIETRYGKESVPYINSMKIIEKLKK